MQRHTLLDTITNKLWKASNHVIAWPTCMITSITHAHMFTRQVWTTISILPPSEYLSWSMFGQVFVFCWSDASNTPPRIEDTQQQSLYLVQLGICIFHLDHVDITNLSRSIEKDQPSIGLHGQLTSFKCIFHSTLWQNLPKCTRNLTFQGLTHLLESTINTVNSQSFQSIGNLFLQVLTTHWEVFNLYLTSYLVIKDK